MPSPKTIQEYRTALLRLNVALPTGKAALADYEALWQQQQQPGARETPAKRRVSAGAGSSRGAPRARHEEDEDAVMAPAPTEPAPRPANVPLAQQVAARRQSNVPLAQQAAALQAVEQAAPAQRAAAVEVVQQPPPARPSPRRALPAAPATSGGAVSPAAGAAAAGGAAHELTRRTSWLPAWGQAWPSSRTPGPPDAQPAADEQPVPTYDFGGAAAAATAAEPAAAVPAAAHAAEEQHEAEPAAAEKPRRFGAPDVLAFLALAFVVVLLAALALAPPAPLLSLPAPELMRLPAGSPSAPSGMRYTPDYPATGTKHEPQTEFAITEPHP